MERLALVAAAVVAAAGLASAQGPGPAPATGVTGENPWLDRGPINFAHQGGNHEAPGNTLFALNNSTLNGTADAFEVDLHRTADGHAVAIHDPTVDRTTNGSGAVSSKTVAELKELDPAFWWAPGNGTDHNASASDYVYRGVATGENATPDGYSRADFRIPTLREILENVTASAGDGPTPYMILEIKATSQHWRPLVRHVVDLLHEFNRTEGTIVASFNDGSTSTAKALDPDASTSPGLGQAAAWWASTRGPAPGAPLPQHEAVQLPPTYQGQTTMSEDIIGDAHNNSLAAHVWTINDRPEMHGWLDKDVDGILTDRPQDLHEVLENRTASP